MKKKKCFVMCVTVHRHPAYQTIAKINNTESLLAQKSLQNDFSQKKDIFQFPVNDVL